MLNIITSCNYTHVALYQRVVLQHSFRIFIPLSIRIIQFFGSHTYRWTPIPSSGSSRAWPLSLSRLVLTQVGLPLISTFNSFLFSFFFNCNYPSPSLITYSKSCFKYVKSPPFWKPLCLIYKLIHHNLFQNILKSICLYGMSVPNAVHKVCIHNLFMQLK